MTITAQLVLETASAVDVEEIQIGDQTSPEEGILLTHQVRADRPGRKRIRLRWEHATPAIAESVALHHAAQLGAFTFRLRNGAVFDVVYAEAPSFARRSALDVDIDVALEQAFDSD